MVAIEISMELGKIGVVFVFESDILWLSGLRQYK